MTTFLAGGGGTDVIEGGEGSDTNSFAGPGKGNGVTATIANDGTGTAEYGPISESFTGIENFYGSDNDDVLTGNDLANFIDGGRGDDVISGIGGDDTLAGGRVGETTETGFSLSVVDQPLTSLTTTQSPSQLVAEAVAGNLYATVRTSDFSFSDGEIRGQLLVQSDTTLNGVRTVVLAGPLNSAQVSNNGSDSEATGQATVTITEENGSANYSADISVDGITTSQIRQAVVDDVSAISIHNAAAGTSGPVITDVIRDAGGDFFGDVFELDPDTQANVFLNPEADTGDGNVFVEKFEDENNIINGGDGNDTLVGSMGDDTLEGGAGDDQIVGLNGDDILNGGAGDDELSGGFGDDMLNGGAGNDTLNGGDGDDILRAGAGDDIANGGNGNDNLNGGSGDDTLNGNDGDDFFVGIGGTDSIDGGAGTDTNSFQGVGSSVIATVNEGGSGVASHGDVNESFVGIEHLTGSDNDDILNAGGNFESVLRGLGGNDILNGSSGNDLLIGNDGDDILRGGAGNDRAFGGDGNDSLNGGGGDDFLRGGDGDDFFVGIGGTDSIDGGLGFDTNSFQGVDVGVTARVNDDGSGTAEHGTVTEVFTGIERLVGSSNDDTLTATGSRPHNAQWS